MILLCDHSPTGYLLALDKRTGDERWIVNHGPFLRSYSTPLVMPAADGDQLIVNSSHWIDAYDPDTGRSLWRAGAQVELGAAMPVHEKGVLYTSRGSRRGTISASGAWPHPRSRAAGSTFGQTSTCGASGTTGAKPAPRVTRRS